MQRLYDPSANVSVRALLNTIPGAYMAVDKVGVVVEWSARAEELFGWKAEEIIGHHRAALNLPASYGSQCIAGLPLFIRQERETDLIGVPHYVAINVEGEEFPVEIRSNFGPTLESQTLFRLQIFDLRPRMLVEDRMLQAAKMESIGELVSGLAHDFNNILGVICGSLETLELRVTDPIQRELIELADGAAERGREITRAMLDVARRQPQMQELVSLNEALKRLQPLLKQTANHEIVVSVLAEAGRSDVKIDRSAFDNAILNFVINSRDAMPDGGVVIVYTQNVTVHPGDPIESVDLAPGDYVVVGVDDNGSGMAPEVLARAMEPFFTTKGKSKGTGLGLSMAYALARQSRGALRIRSSQEKGTSIHLFLPLVATEPLRNMEGAR